MKYGIQIVMPYLTNPYEMPFQVMSAGMQSIPSSFELHWLIMQNGHQSIEERLMCQNVFENLHKLKDY